MKVFKFGGASVRSADGVRNLCEIVSNEPDRLIVIVSAMGKTTNALESVTDCFTGGDRAGAIDALAVCRELHTQICGDLFGDCCPAEAGRLLAELEDTLSTADPSQNEYEYWYDRIVSYGEMLSTTIISAYLQAAGIVNRLLDMRQLFITDGRHRDADIDMDGSAPRFCKAISEDEVKVFIGQGFIGANRDGEVTTLGREGSDYSAAAAAYMSDSESVTIWKDVEGIMNADPKFFPDTVFIPELTYLDAIELAYSGAQIIHPKTIKPLQNKNIPLYVRPFGDYRKPGSVIKGEIAGKIESPILILKHNQVLLSIRPNDFSFVLEERLARIFSMIERCGIKINLIQSSAVNLSLCIDESRRLDEIVDQLAGQGFRVVYNTGMELLTIRGYTRRLYDKYDDPQNVYLTQKTRKIVRFVRKRTDA